PPGHGGHRQHQRGAVPDHGERLPRVERGGAVPGRRVDADRALGQPGGQGVHERLNPAASRREVVGDDQYSAHLAPVTKAVTGAPAASVTACAVKIREPTARSAPGVRTRRPARGLVATMPPANSRTRASALLAATGAAGELPMAVPPRRA